MKLEYYGGDGWGSMMCAGRFEVKHSNNSQIFTDKTKARHFYDSLQCEKAAWDLTGHRQELMEAHHFHIGGKDELPF